MQRDFIKINNNSDHQKNRGFRNGLDQKLSLAQKVRFVEARVLVDSIST